MELQKASKIEDNVAAHICLYGKSNTGKTYACRSLQGKTLVLNADKGHLSFKGADHVDFLTPSSFEDVISFMKDLKKGTYKDYDNLVIDSVSTIADLLKKYLKKKGVTGFDFWGQYCDFIQTIIEDVRSLEGINTVSIFELVNKENEVGVLEKGFGLQGSLASRVPYFYDFVFAAVSNTKDNKVTRKFQTMDGGGYTCKARGVNLEKYIEPDLGLLINKLKSKEVTK